MDLKKDWCLMCSNLFSSLAMQHSTFHHLECFWKWIHYSHHLHMFFGYFTLIPHYTNMGYNLDVSLAQVQLLREYFLQALSNLQIEFEDK